MDGRGEIWILGASGRSGRAIATRLAAVGAAVVLIGRDVGRLNLLATTIGGTARVAAFASVPEIAAAIVRDRPAVVVNTIGPFVETAVPLARACLPTTHYLDLSNELEATRALLGLQAEAAACGRTLVSGAGFGVFATEAVVLRLCEGQPPAHRVRVDAMAAVTPEAGQVGMALAATIVDVLAAGGRQYQDGRLVRCRLFADLETLTRPDGTRVKTATGPSGELEAARRASGASFAAAGSSLVPTAALPRAVLPAALTLLAIRPWRDFAKRRIAAIAFKPPAPGGNAPPPTSWAHARVEWANGDRREGWLRMGDAMTFTSGVAAEVAWRLARGEGRPGAYTPGALFGASLAADLGATFMV